MDVKPSLFLTPRVGRIATTLVIAGLAYLLMYGVILPWLEIRSDLAEVMTLTFTDEVEIFAESMDPMVVAVGITLSATTIFGWRIVAAKKDDSVP